MPDGDKKYWYNISTGQVEFGMQSPAVDRAGPFDTAEEAAQAPAIIRARSNAWAEEEIAEGGWDVPGSTPAS